jgi:hypothetical protein
MTTRILLVILTCCAQQSNAEKQQNFESVPEGISESSANRNSFQEGVLCKNSAELKISRSPERAREDL